MRNLTVAGWQGVVNSGLVDADIVNASTSADDRTRKDYGLQVRSRTSDCVFAWKLMVEDLTIAPVIARDGNIRSPSAGPLRDRRGACALLGPRSDPTPETRPGERHADPQINQAECQKVKEKQ